MDEQLVPIFCDYNDRLKESGMCVETESQLSPLGRLIVEWFDP